MATAPAHIVIAVHGIRTYGLWQERLKRLLQTQVPNVQMVTLKLPFMSAPAYLFPPLRWLVRRRFVKKVEEIAGMYPQSRIDLIGHSFGCYLIAGAINALSGRFPHQFHTVVLAASVLPEDFNWDTLVRRGLVKRVVNDCGRDDAVLALNKLFVPLAGMAGRIGTQWQWTSAIHNRFFVGGHSLYFRASPHSGPDEFMNRYWVPLFRDGSGDVPLAPEVHADRLQNLVSIILQSQGQTVKQALYIVFLVVVVGLPTYFAFRAHTALNTAMRERALALDAQQEAEKQSRKAETAQQLAEERSYYAKGQSALAEAARKLAEQRRLEAEGSAARERAMRQRADELLVLSERRGMTLRTRDKDSKARELSALSQFYLQSDPDLGLLLGVEAFRFAENCESRSALLAAIASFGIVPFHLSGQQSDVKALAFTDDGSRLLSAARDGVVVEWNLAALGTQSTKALSFVMTQGDNGEAHPLEQARHTASDIDSARQPWTRGVTTTLTDPGLDVLRFKFLGKDTLFTAPEQGFTLLYYHDTTDSFEESATEWRPDERTFTLIGGKDTTRFRPGTRKDRPYYLSGNPLNMGTAEGFREWSQLKCLTLTSLAINPHSDRLASARQSNAVVVTSLRQGPKAPLVAQLPTGWDFSDPDRLTFSRSGSLLAAMQGRRVIVWNCDDSTTLRTVTTCNADSVSETVYSTLAFSRDERRLASAHWDGTIEVWDIATGHREAVIHARERIHWPRTLHFYLPTMPGIKGIAFCADGEELLVCANTDSLFAFGTNDGASRECPFGAPGHHLELITVSDNGELVAAYSGEGAIHVWNARTGALLCEPLTNVGFRCDCMSFSRDNAFLAVGGVGGHVALWPLGGRNRVRHILGGMAVGGKAYDAMAASQELVAASEVNPLGFTAIDLFANVDNTFRKSIRCTLRGRARLAFSSDGRMLACGFGGDVDGGIEVWHISDSIAATEAMIDDGISADAVCIDRGDSILYALDVQGGSLHGWELHSSRPSGTRWVHGDEAYVSLARSGRHGLLVGCKSNGLAEIRGVGGDYLASTGHQFASNWGVVSLSSNGRFLARGGTDSLLSILDLVSGAPSGSLNMPSGYAVAGLSFMPSSDSLLAAAYSEGSLALWNTRSNELACAPKRYHDGAISSLAVSDHPQNILTADLKGHLVMWELANGELKSTGTWQQRNGISVVAELPKGGGFITGDVGGVVTEWVLNEGVAKGRHSQLSDEVLTALATDECGLIAIGTASGSIAILDARELNIVRKLFDAHERSVTGLAFLTPDSLVSVGEDGAMWCWDLTTPARVRALPAITLYADDFGQPLRGNLAMPAFGTNGRSLIAATSDTGIRVYNPEGRSLVGVSLFGADTIRVISSGNKTGAFAMGCVNRRIYLYLPADSVPRILTELPNNISAMCFSPGDELLAAGDESGHVMVWEAGTGKRYLRLATAEGVAVSSLAFGCDGSSLLVNTRGGGIESIDLVTDHWLSFAACAANRTLTPIERALYIDSTFSDSN